MTSRTSLAAVSGKLAGEQADVQSDTSTTEVGVAEIAKAGERFQAMRLGNQATIKVAKKPRVTVEVPSTMQTLVKTFGDSFIECFPQEFRDAVDEAYEFWRENPDSYLPFEAETIEQKEEMLVCMRAYAECAPNGPYTIRTIADPNPLLLVWRAQDKRKRRNGSDAGS
jgi:hypothetical protein